MTHKDVALGRTTASKHKLVVVAVCEDIVGPLLAQRQKQNAMSVVVVDDQGAILSGNG